MQVMATENRSKRQVLHVAQRGGTARLPAAELHHDSGPAATPLWSKPFPAQIDSVALTTMMHYYPVIRVVMLSLMLSLTASVSSNMNAIRKVIQDREAPV